MAFKVKFERQTELSPIEQVGKYPAVIHFYDDTKTTSSGKPKVTIGFKTSDDKSIFKDFFMTEKGYPFFFRFCQKLSSFEGLESGDEVDVDKRLFIGYPVTIDVKLSKLQEGFEQRPEVAGFLRATEEEEKAAELERIKTAEAQSEQAEDIE